MTQLYGDIYTFNTIYASTSTLAAVDTTNLLDGTRAQVTNSGVYQYKRQSTTGTVLPTTGPGSWSLVTDPYLMMTALNQIDGSQVTFSDTLDLLDGTAAAPALAFAADLTTGFYRIGASTLGISTGGVLRATISTSQLLLASGVALFAPNGTVSLPSVAIGEVDCGFYLAAADQVALTLNAIQTVLYTPTSVTLATGVQLLSNNAGNNGAPTFGIGEAVSGFFQTAIHQVALAINSSTVWIQTATQLQMQSGVAILAGAGLVATPSLAVSTTANGFYAPAANQVALAINGAQAWNQTAGALTMATGVQLTLVAGTAAAPGITLGAEQTGLYLISAGNLGLSIAGVLKATLSATVLTLVSGIQLNLPASSAAAPAVTLGGEQTGAYLISAGNLGLAIAGVLKATLSATVLTLVTGIQLNMPASSAAAPAFTVGGEQTGAYLISAGNLGLSIAGVLKATLAATVMTLNTGVGLTMTASRVQWAAGIAVTAANNLTLGGDGNSFQITGATQINLLDSTGWQTGSIVTLDFASNPTVKYNQAPSGAFKAILLSAHVDLATLTANSTLTLKYNGTAWLEIGRCIV